MTANFLLRYSIFTGFSADLFGGTMTVLDSGICEYKLRWVDERINKQSAEGRFELPDEWLYKILELCTEADLTQLKTYYPFSMDDVGSCRFEFSALSSYYQIDIDYPFPLDGNPAEHLLEEIRQWLHNKAKAIQSRSML